MTLRLSSISAPSTTTTTTTTTTMSSSSSSSCGNPILDRLLQDPSLSTTQKTECIQTLSVLLKNMMMDPIKSQDAKYRTLKWDNAKLQQKIFSIPQAMELLLSPSIGMIRTTTTITTSSSSSSGTDEGEGDQEVLQLVNAPSDFTRQSIGAPLQQALATALSMLAQGGGLQPQTMITNKKPRLAVLEEKNKLSEKQKARRLLEEQQQREKQIAKEERQRQIALLKQDKLTRETDPDWKPGVSAACAKSGSSISTFRDKYGEN